MQDRQKIPSRNVASGVLPGNVVIGIRVMTNNKPYMYRQLSVQVLSSLPLMVSSQLLVDVVMVACLQAIRHSCRKCVITITAHSCIAYV